MSVKNKKFMGKILSLPKGKYLLIMKYNLVAKQENITYATNSLQKLYNNAYVINFIHCK